MEFHFRLLKVKPPFRIKGKRLAGRKWRATLCFPLFTTSNTLFTILSSDLELYFDRFDTTVPFPQEFKYLPLGPGIRTITVQ